MYIFVFVYFMCSGFLFDTFIVIIDLGDILRPSLTLTRDLHAVFRAMSAILLPTIAVLHPATTPVVAHIL